MKTIICSFLALFMLQSYLCEVQNIKDFRANPLGISKREGLFEVDLALSPNSRVLSYVDFNNDK